MRASKILVPSIATLFALAVGCGGSNDDALKGDGDISLSELPPLYAKALCDAQRACVGEVLALFIPGEDCVANAETAIRDVLPRIEQGVSAGKIRYDGTKIQACI